MDDLNQLSDEQLDVMIQMLQKTLSSRSTEKKPADERPNKFLEMAEFSMHKADSIIDKKLAVQPLTPRTRKFTTIKVRCRVCGKEEEINPALLASEKQRYKCNTCSSIAG
jgi:hypothetical protein